MLAHCRADSFCELLRQFEIAAGSNDKEFLSSVTPDHVVGAQCGRNALHGGDQHGVSCAMAVTVIDLFEVVYIRQDDAHRAVFAAAPGQFLSQQVANCAPVQHSRQTIMFGMEA